MGLLVAGSGGGALAVTASPPALMSGRGTPPPTFTTAATRAIASGGTGSISYAWSIVSSDGVHDFDVNSPTSDTTTFLISGLVAGDTCFATARCIATDSLGATASVNVNINHSVGG
jgi:hypothetical protein